MASNWQKYRVKKVYKKTPKELAIDIVKSMNPLYLDEYKNKEIVAFGHESGRGSGKTTAIIQYFIAKCLIDEDFYNLVWFRQYKENLDDAMKLFKSQLDIFGVEYTTNATKYEIRISNKVVFFRGIKTNVSGHAAQISNSNKAKGLTNIKFMMFDEAAEIFGTTELDTIITSARLDKRSNNGSDSNTRLFYALNPIEESHDIKKYFKRYGNRFKLITYNINDVYESSGLNFIDTNMWDNYLNDKGLFEGGDELIDFEHKWHGKVKRDNPFLYKGVEVIDNIPEFILRAKNKHFAKYYSFVDPAFGRGDYTAYTGIYENIFDTTDNNIYVAGWMDTRSWDNCLERIYLSNEFSTQYSLAKNGLTINKQILSKAFYESNNLHHLPAKMYAEKFSAIISPSITKENKEIKIDRHSYLAKRIKIIKPLCTKEYIDNIHKYQGKNSENDDGIDSLVSLICLLPIS